MKLIFCIAIFLIGCAQLINGQQQPVRIEGNGVYFTTCSGSVEDWSSCFMKAKKTCNSSYDITERNESPVGGKREIRFICNK